MANEADWTQLLDREGRVEFNRSWVRTVLAMAGQTLLLVWGLFWTLRGHDVYERVFGPVITVVFGLAILMTIDLMPSRREPALVVDRMGLTFRRRVPLHVPWDRVTTIWVRKATRFGPSIVAVDTWDQTLDEYAETLSILGRAALRLQRVGSWRRTVLAGFLSVPAWQLSNWLALIADGHPPARDRGE